MGVLLWLGGSAFGFAIAYFIQWQQRIELEFQRDSADLAAFSHSDYIDTPMHGRKAADL